MQNMSQKQRKKQRGTFWKHVIGSSVAGALSKTLTAPLERMKLILQTKEILKGESMPMTNSWNSFKGEPLRYSEQGVFSFWRGNSANVLRIIPNTMMRFTVYDKFKQYTSLYKQEESPLQQFTSRVLAGFGTGIVSWFFNYPLDVIRVRLAVDMTQKNEKLIYQGIVDCTKKSLRLEGISGVYKGLTISSIGIVPYLTISFASYDLLKDQLPVERSDHLMLFGLQLLGIGSLAGMIAQISTYPLDTVRRRMQVNGSLGAHKRYINTKDCFQKTLKHEGLMGFYRGLGVAVVRVIPASAVQFGVYDYFKEIIFE